MTVHSDPPAKTTGNGVAARTMHTPLHCRPALQPNCEEGIDIDQTKLNGGWPGAGLTEGGVGSIESQAPSA